MADIPGLQEESNALTAEKSSPWISTVKEQKVNDQLCSKVFIVMQNLFCWHWNWDLANPGVAREITTESKHIVNDDCGPLYPKILYFEIVDRAGEITMYGGATAVTLRLGLHLMGDQFLKRVLEDYPLESRPVSFNPLHMPDENLTLLELAREICRTVDFHLLNYTDSAGMFFMMFPLRIPLIVLGFDYPEEQREKVWLSKVLEHMADVSGLGFARRLGAVVPIYLPDPQQEKPISHGGS
ncbi:MAG: hypothetical protein M1814_000404 [Vezdaea aestivalis]|nr:MAG: hypothetical protein M1814_000404 [Vezdaea aestivalis]